MQHDRRSDGDVRRARRALHEAAWPSETGVRIVPCTGIYSYDYLPHYFENRDVDVMADHFVSDIETGHPGDRHQGRVPEVRRRRRRSDRATSRRSTAPWPARACARARRSWPTRCPPSPTGPRQVDIFEEEGVDAGARPDRPLRRHRRRRLHRVAASTAACTWGSTATAWRCIQPIDKRNATAAELLRRGHAERLMVSQDFCATIDWFPPEAAERVGKQRSDPQLVDDARLRRGRAGTARAGRAGRRRVQHDLRGEPGALADVGGLRGPQVPSQPLGASRDGRSAVTRGPAQRPRLDRTDPRTRRRNRRLPATRP